MHCPRCHSTRFSKSGFYSRKSDSKVIRRFRCQKCGKKFSNATFDPCYRQKKRKKNFQLKILLCSGVSQRRSAMILNLTRKTVAKKFKFLAEQARIEHRTFLESKTFEEVELDDLITFEHTKCLPLPVPVIVETKTRAILSLDVCSMPAFGHLAKISHEKYGRQPDGRKQAIKNVLKEVEGALLPDAKIKSDEHKFYPPAIKNIFPKAYHLRFLGAKSTISGQGELKKLIKDPLFSVNHTLAMLRANINRLFRRTWCTTKKASALKDHLDLYKSFHNQRLI